MRNAFAATAALLLAACAVGPDYARPAVETPAAYRDAGPWKPAEPRDAVPRGAWWLVFGDPVLDGLAAQVEGQNLTLAAAEARYRQAHAAVRSARSQLFPTIGADAGASRSGSAEASSGTRYSASLDARWEVDLWGRVRRLIEANRAGEEASRADVESAKLSLQAQLATAYFQLRVADTQRTLLDDSVKAFESSYRIARNRYDAGVAARVDVVQAEAQLKSVQAQAVDLRLTRAQLEHAIAVLVGKAPANFTLSQEPLRVRIPAIPAGLPSELLERRPDIAAAERRVAAANAQIGVAQTAWFPALVLSGSEGRASSTLSTLLDASSRVWSLGAVLAGTLLDFGARGAAVDSARASYDVTVAQYRETMLEAFREVEDNLVALRLLEEAMALQQDAARAAKESVAITLNQYRAGTVGFLNVTQVQATQLAEDRATVSLAGRQLAAAVALVRALGGGWDTPSASPLQPASPSR